jgi:hypothetical protein
VQRSRSDGQRVRQPVVVAEQRVAGEERLREKLQVQVMQSRALVPVKSTPPPEKAAAIDGRAAGARPSMIGLDLACRTERV